MTAFSGRRPSSTCWTSTTMTMPSPAVELPEARSSLLVCRRRSDCSTPFPWLAEPFCFRRARYSRRATFYSQRLPLDRHKLVAGRGLDHVAASGKGEMIGLDQHSVGDHAVEHLPACRHRLRPIHIEGRLPIGVAGEQVGIAYSVAHRQHRLVP